uniref:protein tyrosine phosphatase family protein n=1 Tax=Trichocoleus desertorum TaxID=1481672 RepID=UPI0025B30551|nr:protein tyrosine phosphatase family protein [Trichocoleus desertorum]
MTTPPLESIRAFLNLADQIGTAGQPTAEQFPALQAAGYETVVNLALSTSTNALPNEAEIVTQQGMQYVHIPVSWENPQVEDALHFFAVMKANQDKKVFVHCAANMRVSAFMFLYRTLCQKMAPEEALQDLYRIWIPDQQWQAFIDQVTTQYRENLA